MGSALCLATWAGSNLYLAAVGFLYGLGVGYGFPALLSLGGDLVDVRLRPKMTSFVLFFMDLSWFFLPLFMGYFISVRDVATAYRVLAGISITMALTTHFLWIRFMRKDRDNA
jgi:MFS family permease